MGKGRPTALLLAVVVICLAVMRTATASHTGDHFSFSGGTGFKGLVVKADRVTTSITAEFPTWTTLDSRSFSIPAGESQLIVVDFFTRVQCDDNTDCLVRPVLGRTQAGAQELEPGLGVNSVIALDGTDGVAAVSRAQCIRNDTGSPVTLSVWLEATQLPAILHDLGNFNLSGWTLKIGRNAPCSPSVDI